MNYQINTKKELEQFICTSFNEVNTFIDSQQSQQQQPFYSSVDIRESHEKYAPVDHNMYPAGFNNVCQKDLDVASTLFRDVFKRYTPNCKTIGLFPESHTKNKFYLENIFHLKKSLEGCCTSVYLISLDESLFESDKTTSTLETINGETITLHKVTYRNNSFFFADEAIQSKIDLVILNHDQSSPLNVAWADFTIPVLPSPLAGWYRRQKINHFRHYHQVVKEFSKEFSINPDLLQARFTHKDKVDFSTKEGIDLLADEVDKMLKELPKGSQVYVKASQGTYGMGISVFESADQVRAMNRKTRNKMDVGKNKIKFTSVLIQEGIETILKYEEAPAEVSIYLIDGKAMGGFMRFNPKRTSMNNLNAQGMLYQKYCISEIKQDEDHKVKEAVYSVIARLSVLAASRELVELIKG